MKKNNSIHNRLFLSNIFSISFFLFVVFVSPYSFAQSLQYWMQKGGGVTADEGIDICVDGSGNTFTTGYFSGIATFGSFTLNSSGTLDIFLVKTNNAGVVQWAVKAGGAGPDKGLSVKADITGNVYITGFFYGIASFSGTQISSVGGSQDMFLAKYNSGGNLLWVTSGGGKIGDMGNAVATDRFGNVVVTGQFTDTAIFSGVTLISMVDTNFQSSIDAFIAKYDSDGNLKWIKKGSAIYTDRGLDVGIDSSGSVYATGQFSDTIAFDNVYNNNSFNAIFLIKYDSTGNELWFRRMGGSTQNIAYGLAVDNSSNIYLTGDFAGNIIFFGPTNFNYSSTYPYNVFIAKYDKDGNFLWVTYDGSDSYASSRNVAIDNSSNPHITGNFKCVFSQYSDDYGTGTFNSIGYNDIFVAKYNSAGVKQWARQCGGQKDDFGASIALAANGQVLLTGSYRHKMLFPGTNNFIGYNYNQSNGANSGSFNYCSDSKYGSFYSLDSIGNSDVFIAKAIDLTRQPYDYYKRSGTICNRDYVGCCINTSGADNVCSPDSVTACGYTYLFASSNTSSLVNTSYLIIWDEFVGYGSAGPIFHYLWSTGDTTRKIYVDTSGTGTYYVTVTSSDGCFESSDSIYVQVNPIPAKPTISDSKGININSLNPQTITFCLPDSVVLTGGNVGSNSYYWTGPGLGSGVNSLNITVSASGIYKFTVENNFGCTNYTQVQVIALTFPPLQPKIKLMNGNTDSTITICSGGYFRIIVYDSLTNPQGNTCIYANTNWAAFPNSNLNYSYNTICSENYFYPSASGSYQINVMLVRNTNCGNDTHYLSKTVIVTIAPSMNISVSGNTPLCPGTDTITLIANSNGNSFHWYGPGIITNPYLQNISINQAGYYNVSITDTASGCSGSQYVNVINKPQPTIYMNPSNGVICPGGSVTITTYIAGTYQWYGPNGLISGATASNITDTIPGFYFCVVTDTAGCELASNSVEIKQYATPFLIVTPSNMICQGGSATLDVITNDGSILQWWAPLSGNSLTKTVSSPGTYTCSVTSCGITTVVSTDITVANPVAQITPSDTVTLCGGDSVILSANTGMAGYTWTGGSQNPILVVFQSGTFYLTVTDNNGCEATSSPVVVNILPAINPPNVSSDTTICHGDSASLNASSSDTVQWFDVPLGGNPVFTGYSFLTPALTENMIYYAQTSNAPCFSERVPVSVFVDSSSVTPVIASNSPICEGDTLVINANYISNANYSWTGPDNFSSIQQNIEITEITVLHAGDYSLSISSNLCFSDTAQINITVFTVPPIPGITSNGVQCEGNTLLLSSDTVPGAVYNWWGPNGYTSNEQNPILENISVNNSGEYYFNITLNGCTSTDTMLLAEIYQIPAAPLLGSNSPVCNGDSLFIFTDPASNANYSWNGPDNFSSNQQNIIISNASVNNSGDYYLFVYNNGCSSDTSQINVAVFAVPPVPDVSANSPLCEGDTLFLNADNIPGAIYNWWGPNGFSSVLPNPVIENVLASDSGNYFLNINMNGCGSSDTLLFIEIKEKPLITDAGSNSPVCENDSILFFANGLPNLSWNWNGPDMFISSLQNPFIKKANMNSMGNYTLFALRDGCESDPYLIEVVVNSLPEINLGNDTIICENTTLTLNPGSFFSEYLWQDNSTSYYFSAEQQGTYFVLVEDSNGCSASDTIQIFVSNCGVPLPKIFTPNGDGMNDYFRITGIGLKNIRALIFNRWGHIIHQWEGEEGFWDGKIQPGGEPAPDGVYYYVVEFTDFYDSYQKHNGYLQLTR